MMVCQILLSEVLETMTKIAQNLLEIVAFFGIITNSMILFGHVTH